jgi:hypothetical protein
VHWIVAAPGVQPYGKLVTTVDNLRVYRVSYPIRLVDAYAGISTDGANWMESSAWYYRFNPGGHPQHGVATVTLSRAAACGGFAPSHITIKLSSLRVTPEPQAQPVAKKLLAVRHVVVRSNPCTASLPVKFAVTTPFRIDLSARGTFQPSASDLRQLSAQVTFGFKPTR